MPRYTPVLTPKGIAITTVMAMAIFGLLINRRSVITTAQIPVLMPMAAIITSPGHNISIPARPAAFGTMFPARLHDPDEKDPDDDDKLGGFTGSLSVVHSLACGSGQEGQGPYDKDYEDLREKIALVQRGECGFYEKVLTLQSWGAVAVIVGDNFYHRGLVTMYTRDEFDSVQIPSAFVSRESYDILAKLETITITRLPDSAPMMNTVVFLMVSPLCSLSIIYGILLFHRRYRLMKERAPKSLVDSLPTRIWQNYNSTNEENINDISNNGNTDNTDNNGNTDNTDSNINGSGNTTTTATTGTTTTNNTTTANTTTTNALLIPHPSPPSTLGRPEKIWVSSGECIICLEDYIAGTSKVMRLPCNHEFHADCISKWLICRKRTCPICKHDVTKPPREESLSPAPHGYNSSTNTTTTTTETTPLMSDTTLSPSPASPTPF